MSEKRKIIVQSNVEPEDKYNLWLKETSSHQYTLMVNDCDRWYSILSGGGDSGSTSVSYRPEGISTTKIGMLTVNGMQTDIYGPYFQLPFLLHQTGNTLELTYYGKTYVMYEKGTQPIPDPDPDDPETYSINVSANPANYGTVSGGGTYSSGQTCILTATPKTGCSFVEWTKNGTQVSTDNQWQFNVTENALYIAQFKQDIQPNVHNVNVVVTLDGNVLSEEDAEDYIDLQYEDTVEDNGAFTLRYKLNKSGYQVGLIEDNIPKNPIAQTISTWQTYTIECVTQNVTITIPITSVKYTVSVGTKPNGLNAHVRIDNVEQNTNTWTIDACNETFNIKFDTVIQQNGNVYDYQNIQIEDSNAKVLDTEEYGVHSEEITNEGDKLITLIYGQRETPQQYTINTSSTTTE